jgi:hypothetical protein
MGAAWRREGLAARDFRASEIGHHFERILGGLSRRRERASGSRASSELGMAGRGHRDERDEVNEMPVLNPPT